VPAAAREARYSLLADVADKIGAAHVFTAHTRDDQAETLMMRLARGSGLSGLAAMARQAPRGAVTIVRPLLDVPKAQLVATLRKAGIDYADDPTNRDPAFTRARFRELMPQLMREGIDSRNLARLAQRLARANAALESVVSIMEHSIGRVSAAGLIEIDARAFATLPDEIALRLLGRAVAAVGDEGSAELAKLEMLLMALRAAAERRARIKQTLAGAMIALKPDLIVVERAPPRRKRRG
jgi:tRNA(Ile)-lysidine synthase